MRECDNMLIIAACNRWCRRCVGDSPGGRRKGEGSGRAIRQGDRR